MVHQMKIEVGVLELYRRYTSWLIHELYVVRHEVPTTASRLDNS